MADTANDITTKMTHKELIIINDKPMYLNILNLQDEVYASFATVDCGHSHGNKHIWLSISNDMYRSNYGHSCASLAN